LANPDDVGVAVRNRHRADLVQKPCDVGAVGPDRRPSWIGIPGVRGSPEICPSGKDRLLIVGVKNHWRDEIAPITVACVAKAICDPICAR
jgi:hypothetical protein